MITRPYGGRKGPVMSETQARRWVRQHWRGFINAADLPDCPEADDAAVRRVWGDESRRIAERIK